jgi:hypothetical protein
MVEDQVRCMKTTAGGGLEDQSSKMGILIEKKDR